MAGNSPHLEAVPVAGADVIVLIGGAGAVLLQLGEGTAIDRAVDLIVTCARDAVPFELDNAGGVRRAGDVWGGQGDGHGTGVGITAYSILTTSHYLEGIGTARLGIPALIVGAAGAAQLRHFGEGTAIDRAVYLIIFRFVISRFHAPGELDEAGGVRQAGDGRGRKSDLRC